MAQIHIRAMTNSRLEREIADLKKTMIDKVQNNGTKKQVVPMKSSLAKSRKYEVFSSDEEVPMKAKQSTSKPRSTVKKAKSPSRKSPGGKLTTQKFLRVQRNQ